DEPGYLDLAGPAPRRPEVEQDHLPLERRQLHVLVVDVFQREVEIRRLRVRRAAGASLRTGIVVVERQAGIGVQREDREREATRGCDGPSNHGDSPSGLGGPGPADRFACETASARPPAASPDLSAATPA